ncbi:MAG: LPS export ABC transporter permease LptG [Aquabacterium sp.]|uniref:LPS export ABC transporter permease LptG n=1 Tax=Aquabacterium sp. TaxID=1872578 RepID=UPI001B56E0DC|nr:LPS export ABC transporter permease LptG [Aquabacterium sp.]MBP7131734.1 LPS export ABC transporter permease LptG [Aquabacterium sp.]MBP9062763.1 LPS export ABC transporter permease LptG [Aquabacterium sp.]MDQ5926897.1 lipopolysaccharide export system permease protein [Pseudomonadota bacterium]
MNTVRKLIYSTVIKHVFGVTLAFSALFFFIDFVDEIRRHGLADSLKTCLYMQGQHFYDIFPIGLLIGSILALAGMARTSEFTILRTGGLGPGRALGLLGVLGFLAAVLMVGVGNWAVPWTEQQLTLHKAQIGQRGLLKSGSSGTWLRERRDTPGEPSRTITVNVVAAVSDMEFGAVRIFEFDTEGRLQRRLSAREARIEPLGGEASAQGSIWHLKGVQETLWLQHDQHIDEQSVRQGAQLVRESQHDAMDWRSSLTPLVVSASVLPPETMSTFALWRYTEHLASNAQAAQRYEIEFWKKSFYPLVCLVMVALALPYAYLHARSGGMSLKIFGGVMLGISFVLANHISSHLGLLHDWKPWLAAVAPSVVYLLLSMSAFAWLVRYR